VLTLNVDVLLQGKATVSVTAMDGRTVHSSEVMLDLGENRIQLPIESRGILNVSVTAGNDRRTVRTVFL
jgi:hypothetical protein